MSVFVVMFVSEAVFSKELSRSCARWEAPPQILAPQCGGRNDTVAVKIYLEINSKLDLRNPHTTFRSSTNQSTYFKMASQGPPQGPPGNPFNIRPGQQPTPEQIAAMQRQLAIDAQKNGMTVPEFVAKLKQQQLAMQQAQQQAAQQGGQPQPQGQPQQGAPQPITPGPPKPEALAVAQFLKSQDLKPRTCILNGQRKDMFKGRILQNLNLQRS